MNRGLRVGSILCVVLLVLACGNPVAALEQQQVVVAADEDDEVVEGPDGPIHIYHHHATEGDLAVLVYGDDGGLYAITTSATHPFPWFKTIKPYETLKLLRDGEGNALHTADGNVIFLIYPPADISGDGGSWPLPGATAQPVPAAAAMGGVGGSIVAIYLVPGVGEVALLVTGAVIVGGVTYYYVATSNDPVSVLIRDAFSKNTATLVRFADNVSFGMIQNVDHALSSSIFSAVLQTDFHNLQQDYNDAKNKGRPVPGGDQKNKDTTGHRMDPAWQVPYSSQQLFDDALDKINGCPKQIRYYGKDGKAELDIDFSHGEKKPGTHPFPHTHTWENGKRSDWIKDTKLEELFKTNPCKKYLEQKYGKPLVLEDL